VMQGTPREIFSQVEKLKEYRLDVPQVTLLAHGPGATGRYPDASGTGRSPGKTIYCRHTRKCSESQPIAAR